MSHRDSHISGQATVVAPRGVTSRAPNSSPMPADDRVQTELPDWDTLYQLLSPEQRGTIVELALRQGYVTPAQIPQVSSTAPQELRAFLQRLLGNTPYELEPTHPAPIQVLDADLDAMQREAVARAIQTPDLCLIQGGPGSGRSRVLAEIVRQVARRGQRTLLLAPASPALDQVLSRVADDGIVCPVRCLSRGEAAQAANPVPGMLPAGLVPQLRSQLTALEQRLTALQAQQPVLEHLDQLLQDEVATQSRVQDLETRRLQLAAEIEQALTGPSNGSISPIQEQWRERQAQVRLELEKLQTEEEASALQRRVLTSKIADLTADLETLRPIKEARAGGQWWTKAWWQGALRSGGHRTWDEIAEQLKQEEAALAVLDAAAESQKSARAQLEQQLESDRRRLFEEEQARREQVLQQQTAAVQAELETLQGKWQTAFNSLGELAVGVHQRDQETLLKLRAALHQALDATKQRADLTRRWLEYVEKNTDAINGRLAMLANLVLATPSGLTADPAFGAGGTQSNTVFDLLIVEEADELSDAELLNFARRARRLVLVAQTRSGPRPEPANPRRLGRGEPGRTGNGRPISRGSPFERLWERLHVDPRHLSAEWHTHQDRLSCRFRPLRPEDEPHLETERVADCPDIELKILAQRGLAPVLAEVVFPPTTDIVAAKSYLFREMAELPIRSLVGGLCWSEDEQRLSVRLGDCAQATHRTIELADGVRETIGNPEPGSQDWVTCTLEFEKVHGWDRTRAGLWIAEHLKLRDSGRTVLLERQQRMTPELAAVVADLLGMRCIPPASPTTAPTAPLTFVAIPALAGRDKGRARNRQRGAETPPAPSSRGPSAPGKGGAGFEIDPGDLRQRERLPEELRARLGTSGLINLEEAYTLLELLRNPPAALQAVLESSRSIAIMAPYVAQVRTLQLLFGEQHGQIRSLPIEIGLPESFHQREVDTVILSLTRSHTHRAVPYGDGADTLGAALTRARRHLVLLGDPGTLLRRVEWRGGLDHLDEAAAERERQILERLAAYLTGQGQLKELVQVIEGSGS